MGATGMTKKSKGLWMAIIGASFWGGSGAAAQYLFANTSMTAIWLVTVRLLFGGGIMLLIGLARHRDQIKAILSNKRDIQTRHRDLSHLRLLGEL